MITHLVGIDPGVKTGVAIWHRKRKKFEVLMSCSIIEAFSIIDDLIETGHEIELRYEDARLRKWYGNVDRERLQGAGSIKRDCSIWEVFCEFNGIPSKAIPPQANMTKLTAAQFKRITGCEWQTNEHTRDAAMLIYMG